jgi:hypothetical protein
MFALGLVLLVLAVLLTLGIVLFNSDASGAEAFGVSLTNVSIGGLFLTGVITGAVGALGLALMLAGLARRRAKAARSKNAVRSARGEAETLAEENARLQDELSRERSTPATDTTSARGRHRSGPS